MKLKSTCQFLWPTLLVLVCYCLAVFLSHAASQPGSEMSRQIDSLSSTVNSIERPNATLMPVDVVRIQLAGLNCPEQARGILQCMSFASPDNLAVTGPLERFGRMVRSKTFHVLGDHDRVLVGETRFVDGRARVLVTLVKGRELHCFVWVLSKYDKAPIEDCWMTDGVFPIKFGESVDGGSDRSDPTDDVL